MLLQCSNRPLINGREKTYLTVAAAAAATSLTVISTNLAPAATSSNTWADNDYIQVGDTGQEGTEVMQVNGAVISATAITVDREGQAGGLRCAHPIGTPIYKIPFNQVAFYQNSTNTTTGASLLTTVNITPDAESTIWDDSTNTTGYGFTRYKNALTGAFSSYSDGVNYEESGESSSRDPKTLFAMRRKVKQLLDENRANSKLSDSMVDEAINDKQREVAHMCFWSFYEYNRSLSAVANQFAYDIPTTVQKIHGVRFATQPLVFINSAEWDIKNWDYNSTSSIPTFFTIYNSQLKLHPKPASSATTTTLNGALTAAATTITVVATSTFKQGDYFRFIIDSEVIYATGSTSTTFTGCLRGQEGTTAATHLTAATVTERNIVFSCHVEPDDLIEQGARTVIPEAEILTYGAAVDLAPFVGKKDMITTWFGIYDKRIKDLKDKYSSKQSQQFGRIKDMTERVNGVPPTYDPNLYPHDIN